MVILVLVFSYRPFPRWPSNASMGVPSDPGTFYLGSVGGGGLEDDGRRGALEEQLRRFLRDGSVGAVLPWQTRIPR